VFPLVLSAHGQPTFRSAVDLVTVPVTVTSTDQGGFGELGLDDFRVYEDGVLQTVSLVSHDPRPISLCILLDSSPSMAGREGLAIRAIDTLLKALGDDDEVALLMFSYKVRVAVPWRRAADSRSYPWLGWRLSLGTALIDALKEALAQVERAHNPLAVTVIVSDGAEMSSRTTLASLVSTRRQSETLVYGIETQWRPTKTATRLTQAFVVDYLPDLVGDSGGTIYRATDLATAESAARALLDELRSQYVVGYTPKKAFDGTYRGIRVETPRDTLTLRHREGYVAQPHRR
jgi:VWFA-related protein